MKLVNQRIKLHIIINVISNVFIHFIPERINLSSTEFKEHVEREYKIKYYKTNHV